MKQLQVQLQRIATLLANCLLCFSTDGSPNQEQIVELFKSDSHVHRNGGIYDLGVENQLIKKMHPKKTVKFFQGSIHLLAPAPHRHP